MEHRARAARARFVRAKALRPAPQHAWEVSRALGHGRTSKVTITAVDSASRAICRHFVCLLYGETPVGAPCTPQHAKLTPPGLHTIHPNPGPGFGAVGGTSRPFSEQMRGPGQILNQVIGVQTHCSCCKGLWCTRSLNCRINTHGIAYGLDASAHRLNYHVVT